MTVAFLVTTLVVVASPGTGASSLHGCTLGILPHIAEALFGLLFGHGAKLAVTQRWRTTRARRRR